MASSNATAPIQSLDRGLQLLTAVWQAGRPLSLAELNSVVDIDRSSIFRLANTLAKRGFLSQQPDSKAYTVGPVVWRLAGQIRYKNSLLLVARDHVRALALATHETAHLAILQGDKAVFVDDEQTDQVIGVSSRSGRAEPVHCTALGKALICECDEKHLTRLLGSEPFKTFTSRTLRSIPALLKECKRIAHRGFAVDDEEFHPGVRCIAAAIRDSSGRIVASIGISAPASRLLRNCIAAVGSQVKAEADKISEQLGAIDQEPSK